MFRNLVAGWLPAAFSPKLMLARSPGITLRWPEEIRTPDPQIRGLVLYSGAAMLAQVRPH